MSALTGHAMDRALGRLKDNGIDGRAVIDRASKIAARIDGSAAVAMVRLKDAVGDLSSDLMTRDSNGDMVVAIIRNKRVVTLMLRRSTQPFTRDALKVDAVYMTKGAMA